VDPLAYLAHSVQHQISTHGAPQSSSSSSTSAPQQLTSSSHEDAMMATMDKIVNLLSGFQKQFPQTNNQLRASSNPRTHATMHDGRITTEPVQRRAPGNVVTAGTHGNQAYGNVTNRNGKKVICYNCRGDGHVARQCKEKKKEKHLQYFEDKVMLMKAKERGEVLDAEAKAFLADVECDEPYDEPLAITTKTAFNVDHENAYDSNVDEDPYAAAAFMANLTSTEGTSGTSSKVINEVHTYDHNLDDNNTPDDNNDPDDNSKFCTKFC
nr:hypothetical protein [Tanacetum cinerariifolium]